MNFVLFSFFLGVQIHGRQNVAAFLLLARSAMPKLKYELLVIH